MEIGSQLSNWNTRTRHHHGCVTLHGGYKFGQDSIRAPNIAFTPMETYENLTDQQRKTFQGPSFTPSFVIEVDDLSKQDTLETLTEKMREAYISKGVQLGWSIDPFHKVFHVFKANGNSVVHHQGEGWSFIDAGDVAPGFKLQLWKIDKVMSPVSSFILMSYKLQIDWLLEAYSVFCGQWQVSLPCM